MSQSLVILLLFILLSTSLYAQLGEIEGKVIAENNESLVGAVLLVDSNLQLAVITNAEGEYKIELPLGKHWISCSYIGYIEKKKFFNIVDNGKTRIDFTLKESTTSLKSFNVTAQSEEKELENSPQQVAVIKTKQYHTKATTTSDIINRESGVNIRQDGGMGGNVNISINGLQGKQIKVFIDDIPVNFLGYGYGVNLLPSNFIDRIEIYKGIVPIQLGADALGGAVNVVTRKQWNNYFDASYSIGSFNTYQASINGRYVFDSTNFALSINAFYNYSDNNYAVDVAVPDEFYNPRDTTVERFHDQFKHGFIRVEAGWRNKKWADLLLFSVARQQLYDEIQHNAIMAQPYGQAFGASNSANTFLRHKWTSGSGKFSTDLFLGYNHINGSFIDTTLNVYTWDSEVFTQRSYGGEISGSQNTLQIKTNLLFGKANIRYTLNKSSHIDFSVLTSSFQRNGKDTTAEAFYGYDPFATTTTRFKTVTGLAYQKKIWHQRITSITSVKSYQFQSQGFEIDDVTDSTIILKQNGHYPGVNQALSVKLFDRLLLKSSYEYASRLPSEYELFGDFILIEQNANLIPEISHNVNTSIKWEQKKWSVGVNGFFRDVDNIIFLRTTLFKAQHQNLLKARVKGFEASFSYQPFKFIEVSSNITYQDIRNRTYQLNSNTTNPKYFDARLPNIPYLFTNHDVNFKIPVNEKRNQFSLWWNGRYVKDFFLNWEVDGIKETKSVIPAQWVQNVGMSYLFLNKQITITLESQNITNQKAFDNFSVQRPGRSYFFKISYQFNQL